MASFNDIATTRAACEQGVGWALLPRYAVERELKAGKLIEFKSIGGGESKYGVWWLRGRKYLEPTALKMRNFIGGLNL